MCSLGDAEPPAASCQEFINYKNRSAACALCQRVASRSLMACVYATADSAGVCCALQGDKEMTVNSKARSSTAYAKTSCFHHAQEGPMSVLNVMRSLHRCRVMCPLGQLHGQASNVEGIHILSQKQLTNTPLLRSVKTEIKHCRLHHGELSDMALGPPQCPQPRRAVCLDFTGSKWYVRDSGSLGASRRSSTGCCGLDTGLRRARIWHTVFWAS